VPYYITTPAYDLQQLFFSHVRKFIPGPLEEIQGGKIPPP
jgi:hypothetical protein